MQASRSCAFFSLLFNYLKHLETEHPIFLLATPLIGIAAAVTCHFFLLSLNFVTEARIASPLWIWTLPLLGIAMTVMYRFMPSKLNWGASRLLNEVTTPESKASPWLFPWIFVTSILAHLGGASVGREGVGLIMNGSLADGLLPAAPKEQRRSIWLQSALSAGFTGMFGTPWAGLFFIYEVNDFKDARNLWRLASIILSIVFTLLTTHFLETPHMELPLFREVSWQGLILILLAVPLASHAFYFFYQIFHELLKKLGPLQLPLGSLIVAILVYFVARRYAGLGTDIIAEALVGTALPWDWIAKLLLTAFCLASGLKGGEVTPLFFVGATLGAFLGTYTNDPELSKIGLVAILGSLTHAPLSAAILAAELFGVDILPWALLVTWIGTKTLGKRHLYRI